MTVLPQERNAESACDAYPAASVRGRGWWAMLTVSLGVSLVVMDATVVNVALPLVIRDLHLDAAGAQWMNAVYSLVFASLLLLFGRLGDRYGRRRMFAGGLVVFMAASVLAGAAGSQTMLIGARLVQGIGAAMVLPATLSSLNAMFTGRARAIAFAVWGSAIGGMAAVGPLVGGYLATDVSWRWAFWLNIPVGIAVLIGIALAGPETAERSGPRGLDLPGTLLVTAGMSAVVFGLIQGGYYGWWRAASGGLSPVPVVLAGGLVLLAAFIGCERRRAAGGRTVLVNLNLFALPSFRYGAIAQLIVALGEFGLLFALPLLLQGALGYDPLGTGVLILFLALGTFVVSGLTPRLTRLLGQRTVVRAGLALEAVGIGGLALTLSVTSPGWLIAAWLFSYGVGVGLATAQLTSVILSEVPAADSGQASGLQTTMRQLGAALGVAVLGGLLVTTATSATRTGIADLHLAPAAAEQVVTMVHDSAGAAIPALAHNPATAAAVPAASAALIAAGRITTGIAAGFLVLGLAATLALPRTGEQDDDNDQAAATESLDSAAGADARPPAVVTTAAAATTAVAVTRAG